jgi:hypothetical protein
MAGARPALHELSRAETRRMQMKKLELDPSVVKVETFDVTGDARQGGGTVMAFDGSYPLTCPDTCLVSCSPCP